ncbi:MAG TPA: hypothetical protein VF122_06675, partial [Caulobacteraceae bacterium]
MRALKALLAAVLLFAAFPAAAEVRVTFYSHAWNAGGDGMYPHAFIRVTGQPAWEPAPIDETYGFTTRQQALVFLKARGHVESAEPGYLRRSTPHFWVEITDDQYRALRERIDLWTRPPGSDYNLNRRNCIHFVADLAQHLGLGVGDTKTLKPEVFLA